MSLCRGVRGLLSCLGGFEGLEAWKFGSFGDRQRRVVRGRSCGLEAISFFSDLCNGLRGTKSIFWVRLFYYFNTVVLDFRISIE